MEEEEVNYASVVFKTETHSPREVKQEEETVYDEVKEQKQPAEQDVYINFKQEEETVYDEVKTENQPAEQDVYMNGKPVVMEEEEVNYTSLVFKTNTHSPREVKQEEETVYDEVKVQNQPAEQDVCMNETQQSLCKQAPDDGCKNKLPFIGMKIAGRLYCRKLACCLGIHCIILLLGITATCVYFSKYNRESELKERSLLVINHNLTDQNNKLTSENEHLMEKNDNLTVYVSNLTQAYTVLESKLMNLTAENQQLKTQRNNLTEQIRDAEIKWVEQNVSRAQWSVDAYCPLKDDKRMCKPCQLGWEFNQTSCYAINNPVPAHRKTWEEAREDCRGKISDLAVIDNEDAKKFINDHSYGGKGSSYWIGLRVEDGRWKWINGSDLTDQSWIAPTNGHCAISVRDEGWKSVRCDKKQQWICQKEALSV